MVLYPVAFALLVAIAIVIVVTAARPHEYHRDVPVYQPATPTTVNPKKKKKSPAQRATLEEDVQINSTDVQDPNGILPPQPLISEEEAIRFPSIENIKDQCQENSHPTTTENEDGDVPVFQPATPTTVNPKKKSPAQRATLEEDVQINSTDVQDPNGILPPQPLISEEEAICFPSIENIKDQCQENSHPTTTENEDGDVSVFQPATPTTVNPKKKSPAQRATLEEDVQINSTDVQDPNGILPPQPLISEEEAICFPSIENILRFLDQCRENSHPTTTENEDGFQRGDESSSDLWRRPTRTMIAAIPACIVAVLGIWYTWRSSYSTPIDFAALEKDYSINVFGQHLVAPVILKAVPDFWNNTNPKKPLVLSFHGWTGGGKNLVSHILVRNLYPAEKERKKCVQLFDVNHHFSQEENIAKDTIKQRIHGTVAKCERAIFIFDEMDKMSPGLIDVIKPYLDSYEQLDELSFRKCIFIFLSNAGGEKITELALEFWRNEKKREDIKLSDVESHLSKHAFNKKGGFWHCTLIDRNLIDVFVPFLPLEEEHVRMCVRAELRQRGRTIDEELVAKIAGEMSYYPERERVYSVKGCKTVAAKISLFL